jgi:hypothetical protein
MSEEDSPQRLRGRKKSQVRIRFRRGWFCMTPAGLGSASQGTLRTRLRLQGRGVEGKAYVVFR